MANMSFNDIRKNKILRKIEEFPIIGFYLYHVTSAGQSSNWTTSGIKQDITDCWSHYIEFLFIG